jgi:predicted dinucleotide-binding enzyme
MDDALEAAGAVKGKTVIDVTNPVEWNASGAMVRSLPQSTTAGEELAKKLSNARLVKAFSIIPASFIPHAIYRTGSFCVWSSFTAAITNTQSNCSSINHG